MIRKIEKRDIIKCVEIVTENWGTAVALRFHEEVKHAFKPCLEWPPEYYVYEVEDKVIGFAGMMPSWRMHQVWDFIWINVKKNYQGMKIGKHLTLHRIEEVITRGGAVIDLITKEPEFFKKLGFIQTYEYEGGWYAMTTQLRKLVI